MNLKIFFYLILTLYFLFNSVYAEQQLFPCTEKNAAKVINERNFKLIICSFGAPITTGTDGWEDANGISFYKLTGDKTIFLHQTDAISKEIGFKYKNGCLYIRTYTDEYPSYETSLVLVEEKIDLTTDNITRHYEILLKTEKPKNKEIEEFIVFLDNYREAGLESLGKAYTALYSLRNYSIYEPDYVLSFLKKLDKKSNLDGQLGKSLSMLIEEVKLIKKAKKHPYPATGRDAQTTARPTAARSASKKE